MKNSTILLLAVLFISCADKPLVTIQNNIDVIAGSKNPVPHTEPFIAVNPKDNTNLIIGTIQVAPSGWKCVAFVTHDNGKKWKEVDLKIPDSISMTADPYVAFDADGHAYYALLGNGPVSTDMLVFKSKTNGNSWQLITAITAGAGKKLDHSTISVDTSPGSPFFGNLYAAAFTYFKGQNGNELLAPFLAISEDAGKTFGEKMIYRPGGQNLNIGNLVITSDGRIFFFFFVFMDEKGNWLKEHILNIIVSDDGGRTFSAPVSISNRYTAYLPDAGVDKSSKFKDRVYVAYCYTGENPGIYVSHSDNSLKHWSEPVKVSDSTAFTPLMADIAVNSDGIVGVSWFDNRNDSTKNCYDMYFSYSINGGVSFSKDFRITEVSSCPTVEKSNEALMRWKRGGDYHTISAGSDENFYVVWPDARDGMFKPYFSKISIAKFR